MLKAVNRQDLWAALGLLILPLLLFWPVTLGPDTLLPADNLFAYEPWASSKEALNVGLPQNQLLSDLILENYVWKKFIRESLAAGQIPLWNPYILTGQPFLANGQHSALYPFSLLFYLLPLNKAYGWFTVSQLWLAGLGMYIFLRTLRATRLGAWIGGLTYSLSAFFIVSVVFTMIIAGAVWLPLLLAVIEIIIRKQEDKGRAGYSPIPYVAVGTLILGIQTLAGHVEITYYTLLVSGFYVFSRLLNLWRRQATSRFALRLAGWLLVMVILGVGLGAVQLVPMYEVITQNFRDNSVTLAQVRDWALPIRRIITFVIPDFLGSPAHHHYFDVVTWQQQPLGLNAHGQINPLCPNCTSWDTKTAVEAGTYLGILPLVLAALAVGQATYETIKRGRGSSPHRFFVFIFAGLALLSLLFAFGTPLYALLFYGLPGWNQLHSPFRWIFPFTFSLAVLAGMGVTYLNQFVSREIGEPGGTLPSFLATTSLYAGWLLFWAGLTGLLVMLVALFRPQPFIQLADQVIAHSGLAQNAFADGRQFFGYQWLNFFKFFLMVMAAGAWLRIIRCPIFLPSLRRNRHEPDGTPPIPLRAQVMKTPLTPSLARLPSPPGRGHQSDGHGGGGRPRLPSPPGRGVGGEGYLQRKGQGEVNAWKPLAVLILAVDLLLAGAGFNPMVDPALLAFKPEVVKWLETRQAEDPLFRLTSFDTPDGRGNKVFLANAGMFYNFFDVRGYDSIIPGQYARFMQLIQPNGDLFYNRVGPLYHDGYAALDSALLDLMGVRYVLTTVDINNPGYKLAYNGEIRVYENTDALPRAFVVPAKQELSGLGKADQSELALALRSLNPRQSVILDGETNGLGRDLPAEKVNNSPTPTHPVTITQYTPNEIRLTAQLAQPGWLVLADAYFIGWRAYAKPIDNCQLSIVNCQLVAETELTIHRADGAFRAVYLPPGQWEVRFRYSPRSFQLGLYVSFLAGVTLLFLGGYWAWGKLYRESEADSPIKRVAKNSLVPMVMALSNRLIDFAFALLMLRILQPEGAGRFAFAVAFIGMAEILTRYGLGTLVTRQVAGDRTQSNRYLSNVSILRLYLWLVAIPVMAAVLGLYLIFGGLTLDVIITVALLAVGTLFSNLSDGLTALFYAHEKAEYPAMIASVTTLTRVSLGALTLLLGWGIIGLAGVSLVANLVTFIILAYLLGVKIFHPTLHPDRPLQREMMGEGLPLMINHLLATIFFRIDVFILSPTWGDAAVGYYNAAYKYIDGINIIPQYFTLALFPLMSRFAADARDSLVRAYLLSLRFLLLLAMPLAFGTPFVARQLILFLAGERYLPDSTIVLQLLIWFLPFSFINQVTQYVLIAIHQQHHLTRAFIIGVLFNLTANLIFIPLYGYRAAAIITVFSEWALLIPFYLLVRKNLCSVPWLDIVWRPTLAAAVMGGVLWLLGEMNFFVTVAIAGAVYLVVLSLVGGLTQPDMGVVWRAMPVGRLRGKKSV